MKRYWGVMPADEIDKTLYFKEQNGANVIIDVGKNGWTVTFCDRSMIYKDTTKDILENLRDAIKSAEFKVGKLTLIYNTDNELEEFR